MSVDASRLEGGFSRLLRQGWTRIGLLQTIGMPGLWRLLAVWWVLRHGGAAMGDAFGTDTQMVMLSSLFSLMGWLGLVVVRLAKEEAAQLRAQFHYLLWSGMCWSLVCLAPLAWMGQKFGWCASWGLPMSLMGFWVIWQMARQAIIAIGKPSWGIEADVFGLFAGCGLYAVISGAHTWRASASTLAFMAGSALWLWLRLLAHTRGCAWLPAGWWRRHMVDAKGAADVGLANALSGGVALLGQFLAYRYGSHGLASFSGLLAGVLMPVILVARALTMGQAPRLVRTLEHDPHGARVHFVQMVRKTIGWMIGMALLALAACGVLVHFPSWLIKDGQWPTASSTLWLIAGAAVVSMIAGQAALPGSYVLLALAHTRSALWINLQFVIFVMISGGILLICLGHGDLTVAWVGVAVMGLTAWRSWRLHRLVVSLLDQRILLQREIGNGKG